MTHRHMAEVLTQKLNDEEMEALQEILHDRHQLLLHALKTYSKPFVGRASAPRGRHLKP